MTKTKKKKSSKKAKIRIVLFFMIFGSIIGYLSYSFFSNVEKILDNVLKSDIPRKK